MNDGIVNVIEKFNLFDCDNDYDYVIDYIINVVIEKKDSTHKKSLKYTKNDRWPSFLGFKPKMSQ